MKTKLLNIKSKQKLCGVLIKVNGSGSWMPIEEHEPNSKLGDILKYKNDEYAVGTRGRPPSWLKVLKIKVNKKHPPSYGDIEKRFKKNIKDIPGILFKNYIDKKEFKCLGNLVFINDKIYMEYLNKDFSHIPCVYIIDVNGKIIKIGSAKTGFEDRLTSYKAGLTKNASTKASPTNRAVMKQLLHFLKNKIPIKIYGLFCPEQQYDEVPRKITEPNNTQKFPLSRVKNLEKTYINRYENEYGIRLYY